jgi:hypothetical protein
MPSDSMAMRISGSLVVMLVAAEAPSPSQAPKV